MKTSNQIDSLLHNLIIPLVMLWNLTKVNFNSLKSLYLRKNNPWYIAIFLYVVKQLFILTAGVTLGVTALAISHYTGHQP
jgi:hypothetical protein